MSCQICGCEKYSKITYNNHLNSKSLKSFAKSILPYFTWLIPKSYNNIRNLAIGRFYFKGKIRICANCGHGYLVNPPASETLIKYYKKAYWSQRTDLNKNDFIQNINYLTDFRARQQLNVLSETGTLSSVNNVLEIGAGPAYASLLLRHMKKDEKIRLFVYEPGTQWEAYYKTNNIIKLAIISLLKLI